MKCFGFIDKTNMTNLNKEKAHQILHNVRNGTGRNTKKELKEALLFFVDEAVQEWERCRRLVDKNLFESLTIAKEFYNLPTPSDTKNKEKKKKNNLNESPEKGV